MKLVIALVAAGGAYLYLKSYKGIDLTTGEGWSKLAVMFGAAPCGCNEAPATAAGQQNAVQQPGMTQGVFRPTTIGAM